MTKQIGLAKEAYVGAPRPSTKSVPFGSDNHELRSRLPLWNFKTKRTRRMELVESL